jgi:hypothetical protein
VVAQVYNPSYRSKRSGSSQLEASPGKKNCKTLPQPIKAGSGGVHLSSQLCRKHEWEEKHEQETGLGIKKDPCQK